MIDNIVIALFIVTLFLYAIGKYLLHSLPDILTYCDVSVTKTGTTMLSIPIRSAYKVDVNGNTVKYRCFVAKGDGFARNRIKNNDVVTIQCFSNDDEKNKLKEQDVIAIFQNNENFRGYKLRTIKCVYQDIKEIATIDDSSGVNVIEKFKFRDAIGILNY